MANRFTSSPRPASAAERKLIASLRQTRYRREHSLFVIEGTRGVLDTLGVFPTAMLVATPAWLDANTSRLESLTAPLLTASERDMARMSLQKTPQGVLAVCHIPAVEGDFHPDPRNLVIALDCIQDPGNLGTIIRLADWFGVSTILASTDTADVYNPKVVQSTMGALARVEVRYVDLPAELRRLAGAGMPVYGTFLDGSDIYCSTLTEGGVVVMGNEGNGISPEVERCVSSRLLIPSFPPGRQKVESLNVATATAIVLSEFRRRALPGT